ncbi:MAG TPA: hypothetical protein VGA08_02395 [Candidatus Saccharimonadales bacterium]
MEIFLFVFGFLLSFVLPIIVVVWVIRWLMGSHGNNKKPRKSISEREFVLGFFGLAAITTGLVGFYRLPEVIFLDGDEALSFAVRVAVGAILLASGAHIKELAGKILMGIGASLLVVSLFGVFDSLGDIGSLLIILLAFIGLVVAAMKMDKKG